MPMIESGGTRGGSTAGRDPGSRVERDVTGVAMPRALSSGSRSKGAFQPPRNRTVVIAERMNMFTYSAKKKKPKRMPLYSVAKPATISLSASVRSNGVRLALRGGRDEEDERPSGCRKMNQSMKLPDWCTHDLVQVEGAGDQHDAHDDEDQRQLVADDAGRGAQAAEQASTC